MKYRKIRLGELENLGKHHPLIAAKYAKISKAILAPTPQDDLEFPILFYGEEDGQLACYFRSFPDKLKFGNTEVPWAWCGNLMTYPAFRRRGLAQALVEEQLAEFDNSGYVWGGVFSAIPALRLYEKLSFTMVGAAPRLCFLRDATPFLSYHMPGLAARSLGTASKVAFSGVDHILQYRQPWRKKNKAIEITPDVLVNILKNNASSANDGLARFDTSTSWVLRRRDMRDVDRIMLVYAQDDHSPMGYFLVRQRKNEKRPVREKYYGINSMTIMHYDFLNDQDDESEKLLSAALDYFWSSNADLFEIIASQDEMLDAAKRAGLLPLGKGMSFKFMEPSNLKGVLPTSLNQYKLTHYAGDAFSFE